MSIAIDKFHVMAGTGSKTVELSQKQPGELKASGFWGRLFGTAGKDAARNQQVMNEFCASIRSSMGGRMEEIARTRLGAEMNAGRPLKGFMIRNVFDAITEERGGIAHNHDSFLSLCRRDIGVNLKEDLTWGNPVSPYGLGKGLRQTGTPEPGYLCESRSPSRQQLWKEIDSLLNKAGNDANAMNRPAYRELREGINDLVMRPLRKERITEEFMPAVAAFCDTGRKEAGIPPSVMENLKPVIIMSGVESGAPLEAAIDLALALKDKFEQMADVKDGSGMMRILNDIHSERGRIFSGRGIGAENDVKGIFNCAVQCALELADMRPEKAAELAETFFATDRTEQVAGALNRGVASGSALAGELRGTLADLRGGFAWRTRLEPAKTAERPLAENALAPELAAYCHAEGILTDNRVVNDLGFAMLLSGQAVPGERLLRLMDGSGAGSLPGAGRGMNATYRSSGRLAMNMYYDGLAAKQSKGKAIAPEQYWKAIFNAPLPKGISRENLAAGIGREMERQLNGIILREAPDLEDFERETLCINAIQWMTYGLEPRRTMELRAGKQPGGKALSREHFQSLQTMPPPKGDPETAIRKAVKLMATDLHRRKGDSAISVGGVRVELRNNPALTEEAEIRDYADSGVNNAVIRRLVELTAGLCGDAPETRMQRAAAFTLFSQTATGFMRFLGPILDLGIDEHSPIDMNLEHLDNGAARLTLQSPPGSGMDVKAVYEIAVDGTARMTDIRMADFED